MNTLMKVFLSLLLLAVLAQSGNKEVKNFKIEAFAKNNCEGEDEVAKEIKENKDRNVDLSHDLINMAGPYPINQYFEFTMHRSIPTPAVTTTKKITCEHQQFLSFDGLRVEIKNAQSGQCMNTGKDRSERFTWEGPCQGELSSTDIGLVVVGVLLGLFMIGTMVYVFCFKK